MKKVFFMIQKFPNIPPTQNPGMVQKIEVSTEDEEFVEDEFEDFDDYVNYILEESVAEVEQRFGNAIILTEDEMKFVQEFPR